MDLPFLFPPRRIFKRYSWHWPSICYGLHVPLWYMQSLVDFENFDYLNYIKVLIFASDYPCREHLPEYKSYR